MGFTMSSTMFSTPAAYLIQLWPVTCCLETACLSHVVIVPTPPLKNTICQDHNMIQLRIQSTPPRVLARTWYAGATIYRQKLSPPRLMRSLEHDTLGLQYTGGNWVHPTLCARLNMIRWGYNIQAETESTLPLVLARTWYAGATTYKRKLSPLYLLCLLEHDTLGLQHTGGNWVHSTSCAC